MNETPTGLDHLSPETKKSIDAAFDTMTKWRDEVASATERYSDQVFDKMSTAAKAAGWPDTFVEATRGHLQNVSKMQTQMIDQVMDAWRQQLKTPGTMPNIQQFSQAFQVPGMSAVPSPFQMPGMPGMQGMPGVPNPMQFWMQAADMWQKAFTESMQVWTPPGQPTSQPPRKK